MSTDPNSTQWQDRLAAFCQSQKWPFPNYGEYSDRRGGRTAWSARVWVNGKEYLARYWFDGQFINRAREDAAEVALTALTPSLNPSDANSNVAT